MTDKAIECTSIEWKAPLTQLVEKCLVQPHGVRPFTDGKWVPLHQKAAEECLWQIDRCILTKICKHLTVPIPHACDLYGLLWAMVKTITNNDDSDVLHMILKRVACNEKMEQFGKGGLLLG